LWSDKDNLFGPAGATYTGKAKPGDGSPRESTWIFHGNVTRTNAPELQVELLTSFGPTVVFPVHPLEEDIFFFLW